MSLPKAFPFARVYMDDVVMFSKSMGEHLDYLSDIFRRIRRHGLKIKVSRCQTAQAGVQLHCLLVDEDGIRVDESRNR